jgi:hypothetical protein
VTVALGDERHEKVAGAQRAGVEGDAIDPNLFTDERSSGRRGDVGCAEPHAPERYPGRTRHPAWHEARPVPLTG